MIRRLRLLAAPAVLFLAGCATSPAPTPAPAPAAPAPPAAAAPRSMDDLNAILWTQTAAEHHALCLQAFRLATEKLDKALKDPAWTAATEQTGDFSKLPPAVILDVDETVLDHGAYGAQNIRDGVTHTGERWKEWLASGKATALPGAVAFTQGARERGVEVFFISNTDAEVEPLVRSILTGRGFPVKAEPDTLLFRLERPDWTSNKTSRRAVVARGYRVLLMLGDDLGDFLGGVDTTVAKRQAMADERGSWWGERWIVLPNPAYGSWERALTRGARAPEERLRNKMDSLEGWK